MPLPGRAHTKTQNELKSVETERRADRRDRSALASRLRGAETAAAAAGDRLTAVQSLLAAREAELGRAREELADSQAARAALQAEERRLALAVTSLGGRVESEVETLRAEVAALKRGAVSREALLAEITVGTGLGFTHGAGNHGRACRRRSARNGGEGPGWPRARAAWGPLAARLCPRSVFASTRLATLFTDPARCMCLISALWALNAWNAALRWLLLLPGGVSYGECLRGPKTPRPGHATPTPRCQNHAEPRQNRAGDCSTEGGRPRSKAGCGRGGGSQAKGVVRIGAGYSGQVAEHPAAERPGGRHQARKLGTG